MKKIIGLTLGLFAFITVNLYSVESVFAAANDEVQNRIERYVSWAEAIARDPVHGYSQGAENATAKNPYIGSREGPDYDCSALVYHALQYAGFDMIGAWRKNPDYIKLYNGKQFSGDADTIWPDMQRLGGFKKFTWNEIKNNLQRGDIVCDPMRHVAIYIGGGLTVEARGVNNPKGGSYETGDQGGEIDIYNVENRGWKEVYRYVGK